MIDRPRSALRRLAAFLGPRRDRALRHLPYVPRVLRLIRDAAPRLTLAWAALTLLLGLLPALTVLLTGRLVDGLGALEDGGGASGALGSLAPTALALLGAIVATTALEAVLRVVRTAQAAQIQDHIGDLVYAQSAAVAYGFYDAPAYYDRLHRARTNAGQRPTALLESLGGVARSAIAVAALAGLLLPFGAVLPAALALSALPALAATLHHRMRLHRWRLASTERERRTWYLDWLLTDRETAAELRVLGLGAPFRTALRAVRARLHDEHVALVRDHGVAQLAASGAGLVVTGAALWWLVGRAGAAGAVSLGQLTTAFLAFVQGQRLLGTLLGSLGEVYENSLTLADLFEFLDLPREPEGPADAPAVPDPLRDGIRFEGVAFRYPSGGSPALRGIDLFLPAGRITALVGSNGAGKSTLIKLLCRMHVPDAGRITLDGVNLQAFDPAALRRAMAVLFQEPVRYAETAADNIALGDAAGAHDRAAIEAAARAAGADAPIARLPGGYDARLGTWFEGGTDLSAGEWQRIALARAFLRRAPIVVLDEPTSAMDSWAEADWLARFEALSVGRTVLVITHRFTTAMRAHAIHVVEGGRVVESGTHAALVAAGGRYAASWEAQMGAGSGSLVEGSGQGRDGGEA